MKKNIKNVLMTMLCSVLILSLASCGRESAINSKETLPEETLSSESAKTKTSSKKQLTATELDELVSDLDLCITSTNYIVQDEKHKALYPDMLQAIIKNNTQSDIKNAAVTFVAWDQNNLPVKIKGSIDFSDGTYMKTCNFNDINLVPGAEFGEAAGLEIDDNCGITNFKAFAISYETFEGEKWENPYKNLITRMYEKGVKYSDELSIEINEKDLKKIKNNG